ncbi:DNA-directed RNA polymerase II subunit rpb1 [Elsinoe australis]|uniref:DNA-directed RNA polymerase II subunit rpb1 n=1 Tax=Elsinoe australis TaxID=40998 RepID=A0A2P8ADQ3_9PEZI|nr:DNA-directed RNA polymerase II subunit rpb1 [Elsinoe australis]
MFHVTSATFATAAPTTVVTGFTTDTPQACTTLAHLYAYLLIYLLAYLFAYLFSYLFAILLACSFAYLYAYLFAYHFAYLFAYLFACLSTHLSACHPAYLLAISLIHEHSTIAPPQKALTNPSQDPVMSFLDLTTLRTTHLPLLSPSPHHQPLISPTKGRYAPRTPPFSPQRGTTSSRTSPRLRRLTPLPPPRPASRLLLRHWILDPDCERRR